MFIKEKVFEGTRIKVFLFGNDNCEIYKMINNDSLLIVKGSLYEKWLKDNLLSDVDPFKKKIMEEEVFYYLKSSATYQLNLVENSGLLQDSQSALNFVFALKKTREKTDVSLYDGIYIEEFGYLLPTYSGKNISDDALLGFYFSGNSNKHFSEGNIKSIFLTEQDFEKISKLVDIEYKKTDKIKGNNQVVKIDGSFTLAGRPELEKFFNEHIVNILKEPERYKKLGIDFPSSIILYGPPGCGKTFAVDKLVEFLKLPKFEINSSTIASPYIHDTSKKISDVFENAIKSAPSVVVMDEMESYLSNRNNAGDGTHHMEEVAEFLRQIQNANKNHVIVIAMTNMIDKIDPAIMRKGRFDHHIEVGYPSQEEIESLLNVLLKDISISKDINVKDIASQLNGRALSDVSFIIKEAALNSGKAGLSEISKKSVQDAIDVLPRKQERKKFGFGE